jgi:DNA-binding NtrC family response regulator
VTTTVTRDHESETSDAAAASILIVEDDRAALDGLMTLVEDAGYRVTGVQSFEEARRALADRPDVLVTDIRLGAYNGLQLVIRGRAMNPRLGAIVVTGHPDVVVQREAEKLDAIHMDKPIDPARLLRELERALAAHGGHLDS